MRIELSPWQWQRIADRLPSTLRKRASRNGARYKQFVEEVLQVAVGDMRWRELKSRNGSWRTVYVRFHRWSQDGVWEQVIAALEPSPELSRALRRRVGEHQRAGERRTKRLAEPPPQRDEG